MNFINAKLNGRQGARQVRAGGDHIVGDGFNLKVPEGALKVLVKKQLRKVKNGLCTVRRRMQNPFPWNIPQNQL